MRGDEDTITDSRDAAVLAVDVGSQSIRALLITREGKQQLMVDNPDPSGFTALRDPSALWNRIEALIEPSLSTLNDQPIDGIAVTTYRASSVGIANDGEPCTPIVRWNDDAVSLQLKPLPFYWRWLFSIAGVSGLIRAFRERAPANRFASEAVNQRAVSHWLSLSGYLNFRLTGLMRDSRSAQVGYLPFNFRRLEWSPPWHWHWRALGVTRKQMPTLVDSGASIGDLSPKASRKPGKPIPVIAVAADKACEALAACPATPGALFISLGTAITVSVTGNRYRKTRPWLPGYPHAISGLFQQEIQLRRGLDLFTRLFAITRLHGVTANPDSWLAEAESNPPPTDLNPWQVARALDRLSEHQQTQWLEHQLASQGPAALYMTLLDGVSLDCMEALAWLTRRFGNRANSSRRPIHIAGGASRSTALMQYLADAFGRNIIITNQEESGVLGAAMSAALALDWFTDTETLKMTWGVTEEIIKPKGTNSRLQQLFAKHYRPGAIPSHPLQAI